MPIVFAGIAPHGDEIVPELVKDIDEKCYQLKNAMEEFAKKLYEKQPEVIIIATPHNLRIDKHIGVIISSFLEGTVKTDYGAISILHFTDKIFAKQIYEKALQRELPIVAVNYGTSEGEASKMCLDWGTIIPLWFIKKHYDKMKRALPPVIVITPSREIPRENLVVLGKIIAELADYTEKKVAFIASADQGHAHDPKGPYGFDEASKEFDSFVQKVIQENQLEKLLSLSDDFLERAKPDSYWQMLILLGILKRAPLRNTLLTYECPTYFGMLVAIYE